MKFLIVLAQLGASVVSRISMKQNALVNCAALAAVLLTTLIENLRHCSSTEAGIVLNLFLNFEQK